VLVGIAEIETDASFLPIHATFNRDAEFAQARLPGSAVIMAVTNAAKAAASMAVKSFGRGI
jgi:hypothetical protein